MTCPEVEGLAGSLTGAIADHVAGCAACRAAVELFAVRAAAGDRGACDRAELLIAMHDDGVLTARDRAVLDDHLATCAACFALVDGTDAGGARALPPIDPAAYELGPEIARGGMGRIRAAHDRRIGRPVVVKELLDRSPALAARFEREARVTARLQHPGIVPIYEIGAWPDGTPCYVMRRVVGKTLREALAAAKDHAARLALLPALVTAAEAVAFAHGHGIVHRDLTPANIVVGDYGETVVIDWGLAKELGDMDDATDVRDPDSTDRASTEGTLAPDANSLAGAPPTEPGDLAPALTRAGDVLGTAAYMPPEQATGGAIDQRADVYALGALLFHLLAGVAPYAGSSAEILAQLRAKTPPAHALISGRAPRDLVSIARKAMAANPAQRYPDAGAMVAELRRFTAGQVVGAHRYSLGEALRLWIRRHRVLAAALIAGVVAGAIGAVGILDARDTARAERAEAERILAFVRLDQGQRALAAGRPWGAALVLTDALRLGADTPGVRRLIAEAMRGIDDLVVHTPHAPRRDFDAAAEYAAITGAAFSPDGRALAVSTFEGFDIHATDDGHLIAAATRPDAWARSLATLEQHIPSGRVRYTPDGRFLVNEEARPALRAGVWDAATGRLIAAGMAPAGRTFTGTRSADGLLAELVRMGDGDPIEALDLVHGTVVTTSASALTVIMPDGLAPSCTGDPTFSGRLAEAAKAGRCSRSLDGRTIATLARGELALWDSATGERRHAFRAPGANATPVFVDHDRRLLLWHQLQGGNSVTAWIELRDVTTSEVLEQYLGNAVALSRDRLRLAIQPADRGVVVVPLDRERALYRFDRAAHDLARTVAVDAHGKALLGVAGDGSLRAFDLVHDRPWSLPTLREPAAMARGGTRIIGTRADGGIVVVELATGAVVRTLTATGAVRGVALDRAGATAIVIHTDETATRTGVDSGAVSRFTGVYPGVTLDEHHALTCHRSTGGRARYDLVTPFEDEVDVTTSGCDAATADADFVERERTKFRVLGAGIGGVIVDGFAIEVDLPDRGYRFEADLPEPPAPVVGTANLVASGVATWTSNGAEVGPRRQLAAPAREVWFTPGDQALVILDAEGNVSAWDQHLETRTADELAAALRARIGLVLRNGEVFSDEPDEERERWRDATRRHSSRQSSRHSND